MLDGWHEFYALLGTAAAALVALLFVAVSVGATAFTRDRRSGTGTFMSPVVFHYSNVLFLSLVAMVPGLTPRLLGVIIGIAALGSLIYSIVVIVRVFRSSMADLAERVAYGSMPVVVYVAGLVVSWLLLRGHVDAGLNVLAGAALLLLLGNIRNAWDLMLSLAYRSAELAHVGEDTPPNPPPPSP
jgi:hypothetical protein